MSDIKRMRAACDKMGCSLVSTATFIDQGIHWLVEQYGDVHIEFLRHDGWHVCTCYDDGTWSDHSEESETLADAVSQAIMNCDPVVHGVGGDE